MDLLVGPDGTALLGEQRFACALGRSGLVADKREGDGGTPVGVFPVRMVYYRPDRQSPPVTALPVRALKTADGWCDDPAHADYNRAVTLPHAGGCERLWRDDGLYDLILVIGHNDSPPRPGAGSAIFLHVRSPDGTPTQGCVAFDIEDLRTILKNLTPDSKIQINPACC